MIRHYLRIEPDENLNGLLEQYADAAWMEERTVEAMAAAVAKALGAGK